MSKSFFVRSSLDHVRIAARLVAAAGFVTLMLVTSVALSTPKRGEWVESNVLSSTLVTRDFTSKTTTSVSDAVNLAAAVGIHYYFADALRFGASLQYTERLWPAPPPDSSRFQRFAIMPQVLWHFSDTFFVSSLFSYAPRTRGKAIPDMSISAMVGASVPLTDRLRLGASLETPYAFYYHQALSLVALVGLSVRL